MEKEFKQFYSDPLLSLSSLSTRARTGQISELRSLYWRHFFDLLPTPSPSTSVDATKYLVDSSRTSFDDLVKKFITPPDDGDPLMSASWTMHFNSEEIKKEIAQDVSRAFPELEFFRDVTVQEQMTNILFIYTQLKHPYRQGMHELLGIIYYVVAKDAIQSTSVNPKSQAEFILSFNHIEHDSFSLFLALMKSTSRYYDTNTSIPIYSNNSTTLVAPIIAESMSVYHLLQKIEPVLHSKLNTLEIEPQMFLIKFLRLLFSRELPFSQILLLWDGLFAFEMRLVNYVAISLLLRIRGQILEADYSTALTLLLRYPPPPNGVDWNVPILLKHAIYLREETTIEAGKKICQENIDLGIASSYRIPEDYKLETESIGSDNMKASGSQGAVSAFGGMVFGTFNEIRRGVAAQAQYRERLSSFPLPSPPAYNQDFKILPNLTHIKEIETLLLANQTIQTRNLELGDAISVAVNVLERSLIAPSEIIQDEKVTRGEEKGVKQSQVENSLSLLRHISEVLQSSSTSLNPALLKQLQLIPAPSMNPPASNPIIAKSIHPPLLLSNRHEPPPIATLTRTQLPVRPVISPLPSLNQPPPSSFNSPRVSEPILKVGSLPEKSTTSQVKPSTMLPTRRVISPNLDYFPSTSFSTRSGTLKKEKVYDPLGAFD